MKIGLSIAAVLKKCKEIAARLLLFTLISFASVKHIRYIRSIKHCAPIFRKIFA